MLARQSAQAHGDGNEVLVSFDRDGTPHNELLRDEPEIARKYRQLEREQRDRTTQIAHRRDEAQRALREALDAIEDERKSVEQDMQSRKRAIDEEAYRAAEDVIAERDRRNADARI